MVFKVPGNVMLFKFSQYLKAYFFIVASLLPDANFTLSIYLHFSKTLSFMVFTFAGIVSFVIVLSFLSPTYSISVLFLTLYSPSIIS